MTAVAAGDIVIVGEDYTDNWDPANAQTTMEGFLTAENNEIDVALVQNDGMAGGVIAALEAQGLAGQVPVSGQDGDQAALNRVALGTQSVDVWKDARALGTAAGEAAIALCANPDPAAVAGAARVHDARWQRAQLHLPRADPHHAGQPRSGRRRRMDQHGRPLPGSRSRLRGSMPLIVD